jgi:hypothetical protein
MSDRAGRDVISPFQARQTDRQTGRQGGSQTDRQGRLAERQTDTMSIAMFKATVPEMARPDVTSHSSS